MHELYRLLGIPVITTDAPVEGRIVSFHSTPVETRVEGRVIHRGGSDPTDSLLPEIYDGHRDVAESGATPEKLFVSRKSVRAIINEAEITELLASRGFQKVYFEGIPVSEQRRLFGSAREIVAIHGAAIGFLVFNRHGLERPRGDLGGLRLIELFSAGYNVSMYRRYAAAMNAHWCACAARSRRRWFVTWTSENRTSPPGIAVPDRPADAGDGTRLLGQSLRTEAGSVRLIPVEPRTSHAIARRNGRSGLDAGRSPGLHSVDLQFGAHLIQSG